ncbi:uncharacterized protein LOC112686674 [Sipha flava]|uniref:Uncharacterized protein LOC112686674 n=1 Tax=Sipha flava TaxID=143950 RepID=A0A8B8FV48_9HEMI|nr:uncharacterized protein LOC112686674 [Sipha flava]
MDDELDMSVLGGEAEGALPPRLDVLTLKVFRTKRATSVRPCPVSLPNSETSAVAALWTRLHCEWAKQMIRVACKSAAPVGYVDENTWEHRIRYSQAAVTDVDQSECA